MRLGRAPSFPPGATPPLWPPLLATRGPGSRSEGHAHHAIHVIVAIDGELRYRAGARGPWLAAAGVVTAPDAVHAVDGSGAGVAVGIEEHQEDLGAALRARIPAAVLPLDDAARRALIADADPMRIMAAGGAAWTERARAVLGGAAAAQPRRVHPRVRRLLRLLRDLPPDADASLPVLAEQVGLSPGRLMHAFTESIGIPLRAYLAWLRLQRAAAAIVAGSPLAEAAAAAGFADAAHMTRTFRRMFGMTPSMLRPAPSDAIARAERRTR